LLVLGAECGTGAMAHSVLLAEQISTLAAFAERPLIVPFVLGGRPSSFRRLAWRNAAPSAASRRW